MKTDLNKPRIYDGEGDQLMQDVPATERVTLIPEDGPRKQADPTQRIRLLWGQSLLDDLLAGRYRTLVCAVNAQDNSGGIISQLAAMLPTSQWNERSITAHAKRFSAPDDTCKVLKYDMDAVEVLALLRPANHDHLTLADLSLGFKIVSEMIRRRTERLPSAAVSFLGARSNALRDEDGKEPTFETVLRTMFEAGYPGDVYPAPRMWESGTAVYARYPFPSSVETMRHGGF